jgi:hypothetical protein
MLPKAYCGLTVRLKDLVSMIFIQNEGRMFQSLRTSLFKELLLVSAKPLA